MNIVVLAGGLSTERDVLSKTDNRGGKCRKAADEESPGFKGQDAG